jgi:hypothetical protein
MIKTRKGKLALIGGVVLTALTLMATTVLVPAVFAQDQATTPQATQPQESGRPGKGSLTSDSYLADALGITAEELTAAQQKAWELGIQKALDEGLITQAQADALKNNQRGGFAMLGRWSLSKGDIDSEALLAEALGITVEKLQEAKQTASDARLAQAVEDGRITQEQADMMKAREALQKYFEEKGFYKSAVDQAAKDGVITQEQADAILSQSGRGMFGFGLGGCGRGGMRGHGGRGGMPDFGESGGTTTQRAPARGSTGQSL